MTAVGDQIPLDDGLYEVVDRVPQFLEVVDAKGEQQQVLRSFALVVRKVANRKEKE